MNKVLVITTSLRKNSNSDRMAQEFAKGAREAGCTVEELSLKGKDLRYCVGCMACMKRNRCMLPDDGNELVEKVRTADVLVFATPIYYYEMSGQMKVFLDRMNPIYTAEYAFRDVYLLACAAEEGDKVPERARIGLEGWILCFEKARFAGMAFIGGVSMPGEMEGNGGLQKVYELGNGVCSEERIRA